MNKRVYNRVMLGLSLAFAALIAVLALLGSEQVGVVAGVGGVLLGLGWALYGVVGADRDTRTR
ncbi:hypothetical protein [Nonomuraea sp. 3-1Str]|uniref:hypothetical protein n=1 Tax=unclassified Nonomuraea TaxID=2593643 RepID=UPI002865FF01|nr:hypothetical protein [Nonomuraea sp. 3-1Str]MDR8410337.1 hypothetical protein [Nonomuraea sp. 3-1Str]